MSRAILAALPALDAPALRAQARRILPVLVAAIVAVAFNASFQGTMAADLDHRVLAGNFHNGHLWCFDNAWRMVSGAEPFGIATQRLGFPFAAAARCLAVVPALASTPSRLWLSPIGAYNLTILLTPALAVVAASLLVRRVTDMGAWSAAAVGLVYSVSPYVLGCFSGGQTCKAQVWCIPLALWALSGAVSGPRRALNVALTGVASVVLAYTEPTYAMIVPLVAVPWALLLIRRPILPHGAGALVGLTVMAAGIWTAKLYYVGGDDRLLLELFEPASRLKSSGIPIPSPMAQPWPTLLGPPPLEVQAGAPNHVTYLGIPLLVAMLLGLPLRWRGRGVAGLALVVGFVLALGEVLVSENQYVLSADRKLLLPAVLLARHDYPLAQSVMYYRAITVASLGVAIGAMGASSRFRYGAIAAWLLAGITLWDTHRVMAPLWPLKSQIPESSLYTLINADPVPGAVVGLPLSSATQVGSGMVLDAVFTDRPSNGLVRFTAPGLANVDALARSFAAAATLPSPEGSASLYAAGIRYLVTTPGEQIPEQAALTRALGVPFRVGRRLVWRVGPPPQGGEPAHE
ncbi:MAG: hypothetical protein Q8P18_26335 [Pseudomonadota bacterium]|nr:hypothetical protein [Pseudomonadota bacterium]